MFHYQLAIWECQCSTWHEALPLCTLGYREPQSIEANPNPTRKHPNTFRVNEWPEGSKLSFWPNLRQYAGLVHNYSKRKLSFPKDVIDAFAGMISFLTRTFAGGFTYGLPEMFFDVGLLWQPLHYSESREAEPRGSTASRFPSSSWMGWIGEIDPRSWKGGYDYMRIADGVEVRINSSTIPTIHWFSSDASGQNRTPIETSYKLFENCRHDLESGTAPTLGTLAGTLMHLTGWTAQRAGTDEL